MKISLTQISISDRVQAAQTNPGSTDTSQVPGEINPSPGRSTIQPISTSALDSVGQEVNQSAQEGNNATSESARQANNPTSQNIQYDKPVVNAGDQYTATTPEAIPATPQPKSKGFRESLMQQQSYNRTGGNQPAPDRDYGYTSGNPNEHIEDVRESTPISRPTVAPYNTNASVPQPPQPPIKDWETDRGGPVYKAPQRPSTPSYKTPIVKLPKFR